MFSFTARELYIDTKIACSAVIILRRDGDPNELHASEIMSHTHWSETFWFELFLEKMLILLCVFSVNYFSVNISFHTAVLFDCPGSFHSENLIEICANSSSGQFSIT